MVQLNECLNFHKNFPRQRLALANPIIADVAVSRSSLLGCSGVNCHKAQV